MKSLQRFLFFLAGSVNLIGQVISELRYSKPDFKLIAEQVYLIGVKSVPLITVVSFSMGMVMSLQFGIGVDKFGGKLYVPKVLTVSVVRELGPIFTALMVAARAGAGITAELGSMTVKQQVDAIRALGTSPIAQIVIPRVLATLLSVPILCIFSNSIALAGGLIVGATDLNLAPVFFIQKISETLVLQDYIAGLLKTFAFAFFIVIPACYYGLSVKGGTQGVGLNTTKSVVTACIFILIGDYVLTKFLLVFERWLF